MAVVRSLASSICAAIGWAMFCTSPALAQDFLVQPYLQTATPSSMWIVWETNRGDQSLVEYGLTATLGMQTMGTAQNSSLQARVHEVELTGLTPATKYYYRARTDSAASAIRHFVTPPEPLAEQSFSIVAVSDMQIDRNNRDVFSRIITDGILSVLGSSTASEIADTVAMVLIPGDLVDNGWLLNQWRDEFFAPARELLGYVPSYPVLGNHEANTPHYFRYFHLPENGSSGREEHWWYTDYSNLRVIGLDTNTGFRTQQQLSWLDDVLSETCAVDTIDFVFAQLHHPHLSELWVAGELDYTGEIIQRLEAFTEQCDKPSVHFFGHTHGYSRGQSRDHEHLWVNVASSGGNIDYWGEYEQRDYDEFTVSRDEWGWVLVDVEAGANPQFRLRRFSHGDETTQKTNELQDEIVVRRYNTPPSTPVGRVPMGTDVNPDCATLQGTRFVDADNDEHGASHWQVSSSCTDFSQPIYERWRQHENWYEDVDTQAGDDLSDELLRDLTAATDYCWRVRYRDLSLAWSEWSLPVAFTTGQSRLTPNLLSNAGAESGIDGWTVVDGELESLRDGQCNGVRQRSGDRYFSSGGICTSSPRGEAYQRVTTSTLAATARVFFGGYLRTFNGADRPELQVVFRDGAGVEVGRPPALTTLASEWTLLADEALVPAGTEAIDVVMIGTRNAGDDNDSYFDDLYLRVSPTGEPPCAPGLPPKPPVDAGVVDASSLDAAVSDAAALDAGAVDAISVDATVADVMVRRDGPTAGDAGPAVDPDAAAADAGALPEVDEGCGCTVFARSPVKPAGAWLVGLLLATIIVRKKRR